jgi:hypothetical protein
VIEQVAYTWFNRFTALRFMDANGYTWSASCRRPKDQSRPRDPRRSRRRPRRGFRARAHPGKGAGLLDGRSPLARPAVGGLPPAAGRRLQPLVRRDAVPVRAIDDYTELLLPEDLLRPLLILGQLREVMTEDACQDVEIIGWLYQFYISEKKDQVFAGLKKNQKITAENIPAATQLFTPHWIVRYLVENSLGRLWLLNRPQSKLAAADGLLHRAGRARDGFPAHHPSPRRSASATRPAGRGTC